MNKKKRHHYLSKFYLKGFSDPKVEPYLWVYTKGDKEIIKSNANDIAVEKNYFTFITSEGEKDHLSVENNLMEIESKIAPVLQKVLSEEKITDEERGWMAMFFALNFVRSPNQKENIQNALGQMGKHLLKFMAANKEGFETMVKKFEKDTGEKIDMPIENFRKECIDKDGKYRFQGESQASLAMSLDQAEKLSEIFYNMKWLYIKFNEECRFLTSDNPLFYINPKHNPKSFYSGHGLMVKKIEVTMPLSRDMAWFSTWETDREDSLFINGTKKMIKDINKRTTMAALKFVYASEKSNQINRLVQNHKDFSPKIVVR